MTIVPLDRQRLLRALAARRRYRYVRPRIVPHEDGWRIVSPNCSRNIDPQGGDIDIALLLHLDDGRWRVHSRDHVQGRWVPCGDFGPLAGAAEPIMADPWREFWP